MKLVLRFDLERLKKLRFQNIIPELFYGSFEDFFLKCDNSNRAFLTIDTPLTLVFVAFGDEQCRYYLIGAEQISWALEML